MKFIFYLFYMLIVLTYGEIVLGLDSESLINYTFILLLGLMVVEKIKFINNEKDGEEDNE